MLQAYMYAPRKANAYERAGVQRCFDISWVEVPLRTRARSRTRGLQTCILWKVAECGRTFSRCIIPSACWRRNRIRRAGRESRMNAYTLQETDAEKQSRWGI
ncbi:uncharacterized protein TRAVEDRAFT_60836, partial [Trametes versicolor FP-101664 SS1]|uniref:uncharacterized protein n=1 Tax=Trametes versicolor (strain FP-101664) TaxID=717944 RepID=UPI0004621655